MEDRLPHCHQEAPCYRLCGLSGKLVTKASGILMYCFKPSLSSYQMRLTITGLQSCNICCASFQAEKSGHKQVYQRKCAIQYSHPYLTLHEPRHQACIIYNCPTSQLPHSCSAGSVLIGVHIVYKVELSDQLAQPRSCHSRCSCQHGERSCCQGRLAAPGTHPVCQAQGRQHGECSCSHLQDFRPCQRLFMKTETLTNVWQCHNEMATRNVRQVEVFLAMNKLL